MIITDPLDLLLDSDHDIVLTDDLKFVTGLQGVVQLVKIKLSMFRGENFMNLDQGVRWLPSETVPESRAILGNKFSQARADSEVRSAILGSPGVNSILESLTEFNNETRNLRIQWAADTVFGKTDLQLEEIVG